MESITGCLRRALLIGILAVLTIFLCFRFYPSVVHLGDREPWLETRQDTLVSILNVHGSPTTYLHVGGKTYKCVPGDPTFLELPAIRAVLFREQIGIHDNQALLVYKDSGREVRFKDGDSFSGIFLLGSVESCDSEGFVVTRVIDEKGPLVTRYVFDLKNQTLQQLTTAVE